MTWGFWVGFVCGVNSAAIAIVIMRAIRPSSSSEDRRRARAAEEYLDAELHAFGIRRD